MSTDLERVKPRLLSVSAIGVILALTAILLRVQGRLWICACGEVYLWSGEIQSQHNSQHFFDPYTFTHVLHGLAIFWILLPLISRVRIEYLMGLAVLMESAWEVFENSAFVINRYREATIALGYEGDTVINALSDIAVCAGGFGMATYLRWKKSIALFAVTELLLIAWIRDSLLLNIVMLIYPFEVIRVWQMGA